MVFAKIYSLVKVESLNIRVHHLYFKELYSYSRKNSFSISMPKDAGQTIILAAVNCIIFWI